MTLARCQRPFCKGSILTWDGMPHCHLCGRSPDSPITVGGPRQREPAARRAPREDACAELARRVFAPPAPAAVWDESLGAYVLEELGEG